MNHKHEAVSDELKTGCRDNHLLGDLWRVMEKLAMVLESVSVQFDYGIILGYSDPIGDPQHSVTRASRAIAGLWVIARMAHLTPRNEERVMRVIDDIHDAMRAHYYRVRSEGCRRVSELSITHEMYDLLKQKPDADCYLGSVRFI